MEKVWKKISRGRSCKRLGEGWKNCIFSVAYYFSCVNTLLKRSDTVTIHIKNLQKLMLEIYKSMNHLNPSYIWHLHERKEIQYDLRTKHMCKLPITKTTKFGMESLSFRGSLLWNNLNDEIKELPTVASFKTKIKTWMGEKCNCKICK